MIGEITTQAELEKMVKWLLDNECGLSERDAKFLNDMEGQWADFVPTQAKRIEDLYRERF